MAKASSTLETFFLENGSTAARDVQAALSEGKFRCNMMMAFDPEQAAAILLQESERRLPDLILVLGGLDDGRAGKLLERIREDPRLRAIKRLVFMDTADARAEFESRCPQGKGLALKEFSRQDLDDAVKRSPRLWWVMAKFSPGG